MCTFHLKNRNQFDATLLWMGIPNFLKMCLWQSSEDWRQASLCPGEHRALGASTFTDDWDNKDVIASNSHQISPSQTFSNSSNSVLAGLTIGRDCKCARGSWRLMQMTRHLLTACGFRMNHTFIWMGGFTQGMQSTRTGQITHHSSYCRGRCMLNDTLRGWLCPAKTW